MSKRKSPKSPPTASKKQKTSMSKPQRDVFVLVDMDMVLADLEEHFLEKFKETYPGAPFVPVDARRHVMLYDEDEYSHDQVYRVMDTPGFFRNFKPIKGAVDALNEMHKIKGVKVFICTTPWLHGDSYQWSPVEKYQWIKHHLGEDWMKRVILANDKTVINGDILIDDKPVITGENQRPTWNHVLFTAPYNREEQLNGRTRLDGWESRDAWIQVIDEAKRRIQQE